MEIQLPNYQPSVFKGIIKKCDPQVQLCFLKFLQPQIILTIALLGKQLKKQEYFYRLAMVLIYFKKYLNRVDRSMYYLFYQEESFIPLQQTFIINIAKSQSSVFFQLTDSYQTSLDRFIKEADCVQEKEQLKDLLQEIFFQTDYPLPNCKRQTIGVYCETPFQNFITTIRFPTLQALDQFMETPLQQMRKYFLQEMAMQKVIELIHQNGPYNIRKMNILRYCPYHLKNLSPKQQYIPEFQLHNIIITLYKLVTHNAQASYTIVKQHTDPIMRMAEFVTRANIYKNIILAIQQKFGFLFSSYGEICQVICQHGQQQYNKLPKFQFWNGALTIWIQQFEGVYEQLYQSFNYILLKEREANAVSFLADKAQQFPSVYNTVKLELQKNSLFEEKCSQAYNDKGISYENFFEQNIDSFEILAKDFLQHQVDISINELNVHKCGHSEHVIKRNPFFRDFLESIKESSQLFYSHLQKLIFKRHSDNKMRISILKDLIKFDLDFIDSKFTKPVILKEILHSAQGLIQCLVKKVPQFVVFTEEALQKFSLHFDFSHKDNLLDYFCTKSETPNDCKQKYQCLYDTHKDKTVEEILNLVMNCKDELELIDSEIEEQCYESSLSNNSILSIQDI